MYFLEGNPPIQIFQCHIPGPDGVILMNEKYAHACDREVTDLSVLDDAMNSLK